MKITDYSAITEFSEDNVLLVDGVSGTKKVFAETAILGLLHLLSPENHRAVFRGKNLGPSLTTEQKTNIQNGSFKGLWLGDYWEINGVKWRIVDFDYWYGYGNPKFTQHHVVVMPDTSLGNAKMNSASNTTSGYMGSEMYVTSLPLAKGTISSTFGEALLTHKEYLINAVVSGYPSAGIYTDSVVELPNEPMIFGSYIYTPGNTGATDVKRYTISNRQLALFRLCPSFILAETTGYWLRDVASATHFARVDTYGGATSTGAANEYGVRPVFAIG